MVCDDDNTNDAHSADGSAVLSSSSEQLSAVSQQLNAAAEETAALTPREIEIVRLIDQGCSNKQIAATLSIELPTVKNHVHNLLDKLGVHRRGEAAAQLRRAVASSSMASSLEL